MEVQKKYWGRGLLTDRDKVKLLIPGWAGELNDEEFEYIKAVLLANKALRRKWNMTLRTRGRRVSSERIKTVAMSGYCKGHETNPSIFCRHLNVI